MDKTLPIVYASSSSVYGLNTKVPFSEDDRVDQPASLYAATKKSNEMIAHTYNNIYHMSLTGLRFFTVYGPYGRPDMAYFFFTRKILEGEEIQIFQGPQGEVVMRDNEPTGALPGRLLRGPQAAPRSGDPIRA